MIARAVNKGGRRHGGGGEAGGAGEQAGPGRKAGFLNHRLGATFEYCRPEVGVSVILGDGAPLPVGE